MGGSPSPKTFAPPTAYGSATSSTLSSVADPNAGNAAAAQFAPTPPPASTVPAPNPVTSSAGASDPNNDLFGDSGSQDMYGKFQRKFPSSQDMMFNY